MVSRKQLPLRVKSIQVRKMLRTLRDRDHLSQAALAHRLGVSDRTVQRWEAGETQPHARTLLRIFNLWKKGKA